MPIFDSQYPANTSLADDDVILTTDTSAGKAVKGATLTTLKNYLIAATNWITGGMIANTTIGGAKLDSELGGGWITGVLPAVSSVTANGNGSYNVNFASSVAAYLSPKTRGRTNRTSAAPVQCTSLNGTNQYYSKTSPAGMTFTDDYAARGWVKLTSYTGAAIESRFNGTSGWWFFITSVGLVELTGFNGSGSNFSRVQSIQSVPLNRWVYLSAQLDMSAFTATTTTSYVMIDGVDVPAAVARGGTNPTALVQAGDFQVGAQNSTSFFPGKLAQIAVYNAKVTQATMLASKDQTLAGTETSLISAYSFSNSINDLNTTNANNLTANGSAVATNADAPWGGQADGTISSTKDYFITQSVSGSTAVVQVPEGCTIPTTGGVASVDYSTQEPYNMPLSRGKWTIESLLLVAQAQTSPVNGTIYNLGSWRLQHPIGSWFSRYETTIQAVSAGNMTHIIGMSTASNTQSELRTIRELAFAGAAAFPAAPVSASQNITISAMTTYYITSKTTQNSLTNITIGGDSPASVFTAENAYL